MRSLSFQSQSRGRIDMRLGGLIACGVLVAGIYWAAVGSRLLPAFWRIPAPPPAAAATRDERWRQDLHYLAAELPRLHIDPFHKAGREEFEQQVAELDAAIPQLDDVSIALRIMQLVALPGDGHTEAYLSEDLLMRLYPVKLYWFKDGLYVIHTAPEGQAALYSRVEKIDGVPVEELERAVTPLVAHDNVWGLKSQTPGLMLSPEVLRGLGLTQAVDPGRLSLMGPDGRRFEMPLVPVTPQEYRKVLSGTAPLPVTPLYLKNRQTAYWFEYLPESRVLYFQYNRCQEMREEPIQSFVSELFDFMKQHPVERLVVDLRLNGGGNSSVLSPFIERIKGHALDQPGKFFVIIGRQTFSSGILNALELKQKTQATLVGEPTGGRPNHFGEVHYFTLPNSKIEISYSTKYFAPGLFDLGLVTFGDGLGVLGYTSAYFPVTEFGADAVEPEIFIEPTGVDFAAGRDPVLEYILKTVDSSQ